MKPMQQTPKEPTPEEQRWRANAEDPARVKRHLKAQYILFGVWCALTIGWSVAAAYKVLAFEWTGILILSAGFLNIGIGIINNKRILAGKSPGRRYAAARLTA